MVKGSSRFFRIFIRFTFIFCVDAAVGFFFWGCLTNYELKIVKDSYQFHECKALDEIKNNSQVEI